MLSYFAFIHSGIESAGNPLSDGKKLAQRCLGQLEEITDSAEFPPRLLVLLASPAYVDSLKSEQLLSGVNDKFAEAGYRDLPLIGCSVAAVFFGQHIYGGGALLACLASRLFEAKVRAVADASHDPSKAVSDLLHELDLRTTEGDQVHSFVNRSLLALFPGFGGNKYLAPELHEALRQQLESRVPIFGGVASANDPRRLRSGVLFANQKVYRDAIVAARLEHGTPFGISLTQGLVDTNKTVNVAQLDPQDHRIIWKFREGTATEIMRSAEETSSVPLFADLALGRDPIVDFPVLEGGKLKLTREVPEDESFHLLKADPISMRKALQDGVKQSMRRAFLENPIGALGFRCTGLLRHQERIGLDLEYDTALIEREFSRKGVEAEEKSYVGGFFDGEAGLDHNGKSLLGNWSNATLVFGDELRFRTPVYRGFDKVTEFAGLKTAENQKAGIDRLTNLIYDIGFPGAMLSFCLLDQGRYAIVGASASGPRYTRLLAENRVYFLDGADVLAAVARSRQSEPIIDSRKENCVSMRAASREGIVSQYIVPLVGYNDQVIAVLQIDLGDLSYDSKLYETETTVLDALGNIVGAALNRTLIWEESKLISLLDRAMTACQSTATIHDGLQQYLEYVLDAFGLNKGDAGGHIRIAQDNDRSLSLIAGRGTYFEVASKYRQNIEFDDPSPTAQAFRSENLVISNDPQSSEIHKAMIDQWEDVPEMHKRLKSVGSYANVPFVSERGERGTINLVADERWFFAAFQRPVLEALGHRVGFLLETLRSKERESFLLAVSPQFFEIRKFDDVRIALRKEIERFARAIDAEIASLYLWDQDRERYILRAQYNWANPEWLDAAYYEENELWTGTAALAGRPHHIPDLFKYYERYRNSSKRHTADAFGQALSDTFTFEALALQLRIGNNRFGVLTFYRPITSGAESGFVTTDTQLLQQGADNFASLISILESGRREIWRKHEHKRRQEVFDSMSITAEPDSFEQGGSFEYRVGRQVLTSYHAVKINFFEVETKNNLPQPVPRLSLTRDPKTEELLSLPTKVKQGELDLVEETVRINNAGKKELGIRRLKVADHEHDPKSVALSKLVNRVCVPLFSEKRLIGALDIHWAFDQAHQYAVDYQHGEAFLLMLGDMVGAAYGMDLIKRRIEHIRQQQEELARDKTELRESAAQTRNAFQATTAYVLQHHHELRDVITRIVEALEKLIELRRKATGKEKKLLKELSIRVDEGTDTLNRMIEIGQEMVAPAFEPLLAWDVLNHALKTSKDRYSDHEFEIDFPNRSVGPMIWVDPSLIQIAIGNLLDNAFKYMIDRDPRKLIIRIVELTASRSALISIEDTGPGMTQELIRLLREEFFSVDGRISVGVMLSRLILGLHGGSLRHATVLGTGTKTIITLPLDMEQKR